MFDFLAAKRRTSWHHGLFWWQVVLELNAAPERHVQVVEARLDDSGGKIGTPEKSGTLQSVFGDSVRGFLLGGGSSTYQYFHSKCKVGIWIIVEESFSAKHGNW